jgi:hypothetical protein
VAAEEEEGKREFLRPRKPLMLRLGGINLSVILARATAYTSSSSAMIATVIIFNSCLSVSLS